MQNEDISKTPSDGERQTTVASDRIVEEGATTITGTQPVPRKPRRKRKDKTHRHATRHGIVSRYPLETLERLGVNIRSLRRLERELRAELKPTGAVADCLFDQFWAAHLRCLLAAQHEASILNGKVSDHLSHSVRGDADAPVVIWEQLEVPTSALSNDLLKDISVIQKYDLHYGRLMLRTLGMLLILRDGGTTSLAQFVGRITPMNSNSEGSKT